MVILVCADMEWRAVRNIFPDAGVQDSPFGEWFEWCAALSESPVEALPLIYFHTGWGKISAAAATQYALDRWSPALLINLGTCGGFDGRIERGAVVLAEKTLVYDILEQMGDQEEHITHYTTEIDLSWLGEDIPRGVRRNVLVSGDRDLLVQDIPELASRYGAVAGDWESGAIAFVANRNHTSCLILRGVSDLVGSEGGEAYGNLEFFVAASQEVLARLVSQLPDWIARAINSREFNR